MADSNQNQESEDILQRHRKEKRELQSKIQALKKTATKGDKKKKKEVAEEIAKIEKELNDRHNEELKHSHNADVKCTTENNPEIIENDLIKPENAPRISKAQKRREKKAIKEKEREHLIMEEEEKNYLGVRSVETRTIKKMLKDRNLMIHEIPSDGNCLYCAVDYQLKLLGKEHGLDKLRLLTSDYMRLHMDTFLPFVSRQDTGEILTEEQYGEYCDDVANTAAWGGEVELRALSHALGHPIEIIQANGPPIVMGEEYDRPTILLTYHRHMYGLGEHYNSVKPYEEVSEDETEENQSECVT